MVALLSVLALVSGAIAANKLAKWRGLNVGAMTTMGLMFSFVAIPIGFVLRGDAEKSTGTKSGAFASIALWLTCVLALVAIGTRNVAQDDHRETINKIIAENFKDATVEADYVSIPMMGFAPFLASEYSGYFTIKNRVGTRPLGEKCQLITVDFTARSTSDSYILALKPADTYWPTCAG